MAGVRKWHEERRALKAQQTPKPVNPTWAAMPDEKKQNAPEIFRIGREHQKDERQARLAAKTEAEAAGAAAEAQAMSGHTPDQFRPASTQAAAANESATTSVPVSQVTATPIDAAA